VVVDASKLNPEFKYEVASLPGAENVRVCFTCGVCTASCPVSEVEERFNPRRMIRMIMWGMKEEILSSDLIWLCNQCYSCYAHCPQDVKFTDVVGALRRMAVEEGYVDASFLRLSEEMDCMTQQLRNRLVSKVLETRCADADAEVDLRSLMTQLAQELEGEEGC